MGRAGKAISDILSIQSAVLDEWMHTQWLPPSDVPSYECLRHTQEASLFYREDLNVHGGRRIMI